MGEVCLFCDECGLTTWKDWRVFQQALGLFEVYIGKGKGGCDVF